MDDEVELPPSLEASLNATKVSYSQLGKSGLRVSVPIFGAMSFGHKASQPWAVDNEEDFSHLLKAAYDRGLTTWDTANVYSNGLNEAAIGRAIERWAFPRHKLVLLSKCYGVVGETPDIDELSYPDKIKASKDYVNQGGLSRAAIFNAVDASLERLRTPYLDLLQIHRFDKSVPIEETMKALHDLVEAGKVRYLGASSMWCYQFVCMQHVAEVNRWTKFVSMQNHYSLLYREEEREMNKFCLETGVGLIPWAPLHRGFLARPYQGDLLTLREKLIRAQPSFQEFPEHEKDIIKRVQELAERKNWTMSQVALVWIVQKGTVPIVGISSIGRLEEACEIRSKSLTGDEMKWLEEPYRPRNIIGHG